MPQTINVTAGAARYVGGTITETTGKDISADAVQICLGTASAPGTWGTPDVKSVSTDKASVTVKLLVDSSVTTGTYYVWVKITDTPEVEPFIIDGPVYVS